MSCSMDQICQFTALIVREGDLYIARCAELDITSEGASVNEARANLTEAISHYLETADPEDVTRRMRAAREANEAKHDD